MKIDYQVTRRIKGNRYPKSPTETSGVISGPEAREMAFRLAQSWAAKPENQHVHLLQRNEFSSEFTLDYILK